MQPPASPSALGASLYEAFYGLREQPFALTTDPRFLFMSGSHRRAYEELLTGLRRREGVLVLTGETGTGKTTLARAVLEALGPRTFSALILNPYMSGPEVVRVLLRDFKLVTREDIRGGAFERADMAQLLDTLEGFLRSLIALDSHAVVVIDEAQSLAPEALDQIRMLGAYEQDGQRLLQIVLCGQPPLLSTLQTSALHALDERITRRTTLAPLSTADVDAYIKHRLGVAGRPDAVTFEAEAVRKIAQLAQGVPRRINLLCDRVLEEGRSAGATVITADMVTRASRGAAIDVAPDVVPPPPAPDVEATEPEDAAAPAPWWRRTTSMAAAGAVVLLLVLSGWYYASSIVSRDPGVPKAPSALPAFIGPPLSALPPPSDDEIKPLLDGTWTIPGSGQLPDNRQ